MGTPPLCTREVSRKSSGMKPNSSIKLFWVWFFENIFISLTCSSIIRASKNWYVFCIFPNCMPISLEGTLTGADARPFSFLENVSGFKLGPKLGFLPRPPLLEIFTSPNPISSLVNPIDENQSLLFIFILFNFDIVNFT